MERRDFLKTTAGAGLVLTGANMFASCVANRGIGNWDPKGLPTTMFGSTGVQIPRIALGLGSRFCHIDSDQEANELLNFALDNGIYYWDTAHTYDNTIAIPAGKNPTELVISEVRVGEVVKTRRKEIFLSTKIEAREPSEVMKQIELSLKRLHTDRLDMLKIHNVTNMDDVNNMSKKGNIIDIMLRMKEEKVTRFIGFSSHSSAEAAKEMTQRAPFDCMLIAMNHWWPKQDREGMSNLVAKEKKIGLLLMKAVRPRETIADLKATDLIKYALSLDGPDALVLGMDSVSVVKSNIDILRNFQKLPPEKMLELAVRLGPFYRNEKLPWMQQGYQDGHWIS